MVGRSLFALTVACLIEACSLGALDGFSGGGDGVDAASAADTGTTTTEGGPTPDGAATTPDAGSDGGGQENPLSFDDKFEGATCDPWSASRTNAIAQAPGHSGNTSCHACTVDTTGGGLKRLFRAKPPATMLPAGQYDFTVWIRDSVYRGSIAFELYELTPTFTRGQYRAGQPTALTGEWKPYQVKFYSPTPIPGWELDLYVDNSPPANTCFSADDATLVYTP